MKIRKAFLLLVTLMTGCATIPPSGVSFPIQRFYVNNTIYYPLYSVCKYLNISWDYDSIGRQVVLNKTGSEVKLLIGSSTILVNGYPQDIQYPVLMHEGIISVPHKFKSSVLDRYYCPITPKKEPVVSGIIKIRRLVIDAGHGGRDPGAVGRSGMREKDINLDIVKRLGKLFENSGIDVIFTRATDRFVSLEQRADIANRANADLFISVHTNSARSRNLSGFEVYYITENVSDSSRAINAARNYNLDIDKRSFGRNSLNLKAVLWDMLNTQSRADSIALAQNICQAASHNMGLKILGVKGARFYVLKDTCIPAVLVEVGFVSNPQEERYLRNGFYRQQIAEAIFDGTLNYSKKYDLAAYGAH